MPSSANTQLFGGTLPPDRSVITAGAPEPHGTPQSSSQSHLAGTSQGASNGQDTLQRGLWPSVAVPWRGSHCLCNNSHLSAEGPQQPQTADSLGRERGSCKKGFPEVLIQSEAQGFCSELLRTGHGMNRRSLGEQLLIVSWAPALFFGRAWRREKGGAPHLQTISTSF